jgi:hypothetical protein
MRELEKLDRRFRDTAIAAIDAIVLQGNTEAVSTRLGRRRCSVNGSRDNDAVVRGRIIGYGYRGDRRPLTFGTFRLETS